MLNLMMTKWLLRGVIVLSDPISTDWSTVHDRYGIFVVAIFTATVCCTSSSRRCLEIEHEHFLMVSHSLSRRRFIREWQVIA